MPRLHEIIFASVAATAAGQDLFLKPKEMAGTGAKITGYLYASGQDTITTDQTVLWNVNPQTGELTNTLVLGHNRDLEMFASDGDGKFVGLAGDEDHSTCELLAGKANADGSINITISGAEGKCPEWAIGVAPKPGKEGEYFGFWASAKQAFHRRGFFSGTVDPKGQWHLEKAHGDALDITSKLVGGGGCDGEYLMQSAAYDHDEKRLCGWFSDTWDCPEYLVCINTDGTDFKQIETTGAPRDDKWYSGMYGCTYSSILKKFVCNADSDNSGVATPASVVTIGYDGKYEYAWEPQQHGCVNFVPYKDHDGMYLCSDTGEMIKYFDIMGQNFTTGPKLQGDLLGPLSAGTWAWY